MYNYTMNALVCLFLVLFDVENEKNNGSVLFWLIPPSLEIARPSV